VPKLPRYVVILALLFCFPSMVLAQVPLHVLERPEVRMRLMDAPCSDPKSAMIAMNLPAELHPKLKAIESSWLMKDGSWQEFAGCWVEVSKEMAGVDGFFVVFSDGGYGVAPRADFKKTKGTVGI
jgi:hypothetical protein